MDALPDQRPYQLAHFAGAFSNEDRDQLCRVLRRADKMGGWRAPPHGAGAAWIIVTHLEERLVIASRFGTDLVFTGRSAGRIATAVEGWIDEQQAALHGDRPGRSGTEDRPSRGEREAARTEEPDKGSTPPVR